MKKHGNSVPRSIKRAFPKVKTIIDARNAVSVHVTTKDCKNGEAMNPSECALAKAVKRVFHADAAIIGLGASYIIKGTKATRFHTPERVRREIVSFDRNKDFAEGNYILAKKSPSNRLGVKHRSYAKDKRTRHDNSKKIHVKSARVRVLNTSHV